MSHLLYYADRAVITLIKQYNGYSKETEEIGSEGTILVSLT